MIVMPANSTGWFWHCLAREAGKIGHLYSPGAQRGPYEWLPYALDNGAFAAWDQKNNIWHEDRWIEHKWKILLMWASVATIPRNGGYVKLPPLWAIVPDVPGNSDRTLERWERYATYVQREFGFPLAIAVQDGMTPDIVRSLSPAPDVICVGGTTEWKWATVEMWAQEFKRVHLLRCNLIERVIYLEGLGVESCDGTGWNKGHRDRTQALEDWARGLTARTSMPLAPYVCRAQCAKQQIFA